MSVLSWPAHIDRNVLNRVPPPVWHAPEDAVRRLSNFVMEFRDTFDALPTTSLDDWNEDPGVAIWFTIRNKQHAVVCDAYTTQAANMWAVADLLKSIIILCKRMPSTREQVLASLESKPIPQRQQNRSSKEREDVEELLRKLKEAADREFASQQRERQRRAQREAEEAAEIRRRAKRAQREAYEHFWRSGHEHYQRNRRQQNGTPPPAGGTVNWRAVLGPATTIDEVNTAYRRMAARAHPDKGGSHETMVALNLARDAALKELQV